MRQPEASDEEESVPGSNRREQAVGHDQNDTCLESFDKAQEPDKNKKRNESTSEDVSKTSEITNMLPARNKGGLFRLTRASHDSYEGSVPVDAVYH